VSGCSALAKYQDEFYDILTREKGRHPFLWSSVAYFRSELKKKMKLRKEEARPNQYSPF
jgi:hypothetical protein